MNSVGLLKTTTTKVTSRDSLIKKVTREIDQSLRTYCDAWGKPEPTDIIAHMTKLMTEVAEGKELVTPILLTYPDVLKEFIKLQRDKYELTDAELLTILNKLISVVVRLMIITERGTNKRMTAWAE